MPAKTKTQFLAWGKGSTVAAETPRPPGRGSVWVPVIPALATFAVMLAGIGHPSFWRDEATTLSAVERSFPQLLRLVSHADTVHAAYYLLMWVVVRVAGTSETAVRLPSAIAMAVAAGVIALLGKRLVSTRAGLAAALVFTALPQVSWYGQDARDYAPVTAFAVIASYLLVRALDAPPETRRRWLAGYAASLAALGLGNLFALLLIPAHALTLVAQVWRGHRPPARNEPGTHGGSTDDGGSREGAAAPPRAPHRPPVLGWLAAAGAGVLLTTPVMVLGWKQRGQVSWIKPVGAGTLKSVAGIIGPPALFGALLVITAAAIIVAALRGKARFGTDWPWPLAALCVPWLVVPPALLLAVSLSNPVYVPRYILFCLPAAALLVGTGLAALGRVAGPVALILIVLLALPAQVHVRRVAGHGENLRRVSEILGTRAHHGDAVLFASHFARKIEIAYPAGFRHVRDINLGLTATQIAGSTSLNAPSAVTIRRLTTVDRLWVIQILRHRQPVPPLARLGFRFVRDWTVTGFRLEFYSRDLGH